MLLVPFGFVVAGVAGAYLACLAPSGIPLAVVCFLGAMLASAMGMLASIVDIASVPTRRWWAALTLALNTGALVFFAWYIYGAYRALSHWGPGP